MNRFLIVGRGALAALLLVLNATAARCAHGDGGIGLSLLGIGSSPRVSPGAVSESTSTRLPGRVSIEAQPRESRVTDHRGISLDTSSRWDHSSRCWRLTARVRSSLAPISFVDYSWVGRPDTSAGKVSLPRTRERLREHPSR